MVHDIEMLMSQYADDTTLFFDEDINSYNYAIKFLKWFEKISGLAINNDKTKVVRIRASRDRSIPWQGKYGFEWTSSLFNIQLMSEITILNIHRKVGEV